MTSYNRDYWMAFGAHQKATVGDMKFSVTNYDHMGWMKCDGRTLNVDDFKFLFNVIGYSFGGSGSQFQLPNPAGRVPGVVGTGHDSNPVYSTITMTLGSNIGEYNHTLSISEMPTHNHSITDPGHSHTNNATGPTTGGGGTGNGYGLVYQNGANTMNASVNSGNEINLYQASIALQIDSNTTGITINNTGGSNAHNNIQPTLPMGNMFIYNGRPLWGVTPYGLTSTIW